MWSITLNAINRMWNKSFMPILFIFVVNIQTTYSQLPTDSISFIIRREVDNRLSPSLIIGIINKQGRQSIGYGEINDINNQSPDSNTLYELGSITKVFTCILLADMVIKREVNLDDPISKFLPSSVNPPKEQGREITLLDLATHRSGLPFMADNQQDPLNPYGYYTVSQLYSFLSSYKLTYSIGSRYEYSNLGVGLLGHILSLVANKEYEELVKERICIPLKMNRTVITVTEDLMNNISTGHDEYGRPVQKLSLPVIAGAGALRSTTNDMLTFAAVNLGLIHTSLDSAIKLTHGFRDSTDSPNFTLGLGWEIYEGKGNRILLHGGTTPGYKAWILLIPQRSMGIIALSNSRNETLGIASHILDPIYPIRPYQYKWKLKDTIDITISKKNVDVAIKLYYDIKKTHQRQFLFDEEQLNNIGYELLQAKKVKDAIKILKLNAKEYPQSFNVYDSLGEAYMINKNYKLAIKNYEKAIELNPNNINAIRSLNKVKQQQTFNR